MINEDAQSSELFLSQAVFSEGSGFTPEGGTLFLSNPSGHDILVRLSAQMPLRVPASVVIPSGKRSVRFPIRVADDALLNRRPYEALLEARTGGWKPAQRRFMITDDERPLFDFVLPNEVVQGRAAKGKIVAANAGEVDLVFRLTSDSARLTIPSEVILPAGKVETEFDFNAPPNSQSSEPGMAAQVRVCAVWESQIEICKNIQVFDDQADVRSILFGLSNAPGALLTGNPVQMQAVLVNGIGTKQIVTVPATLELLAHPSIAGIPPDGNSIQFQDGFWQGEFRVTGEGLGVSFGITAAGVQHTSQPIDILSGESVSLKVIDFIHNPGSGRLLILEQAATNRSARLLDFNPADRKLERSLDLPRPPLCLTISKDGMSAWIGLTGAVARVNLAEWKLDPEIAIPADYVNARVVALLSLAGERMAGVVGSGPNASLPSWKMVLFEDGTLRGAAAGALNSIQTLGLAMGRSESEFFCQAGLELQRYRVDGIEVVLEKRGTLISLVQEGQTGIALHGNRIFRANGEVFSADTLERVDSFFREPSLLFLPIPERDLIMELGRNAALAFIRQGDKSVIGSHTFPADIGTPRRLVRWGSRGFAHYNPMAQKLVLFETPMFIDALPDLAVTSDAPDRIDLPRKAGQPATFLWSLTVTNRGAGAAFAVQLSLSTGEVFNLGSMAPGEGKTVALPRGSYSPGIMHARANASSANGETLMSDNTALIVTRIGYPTSPEFKSLILGVADLIASPTGDRVYASITKANGEPEDAVVVIDPEHGRVETVLPAAPNPGRLQISDDGAQLFCVLDRTNICRWNLTSGQRESLISVTNEMITDIRVMPGRPLSLVVATTKRLSIYDDANIRASANLPLVDQRFLGFLNSTLWSAEPGKARSWLVTDTEFRATQALDIFLPSGYYEFSHDGQRLFFADGIFDTVQKAMLPALGGRSPLPENPLAAIWAAADSRILKYDLTTLKYQSDQTIPTSSGLISKIVRFGSDGFAVLSGSELLFFHSPLINRDPPNDLAVVVNAPEPMLVNEPLTWSITVTNKLDTAARGVEVRVQPPASDFEVTPPVSFPVLQNLYFTTNILAAHSSFTVEFKANFALDQNLIIAA
ncbi:MAG: hypothetical protein AB1813_26895, partial [Verrucomicrobiota bacterium]